MPPPRGSIAGFCKIDYAVGQLPAGLELGLSLATIAVA
jgi:hypothetical protein